MNDCTLLVYHIQLNKEERKKEFQMMQIQKKLIVTMYSNVKKTTRRKTYLHAARSVFMWLLRVRQVPGACNLADHTCES